jgi:hypothetical protein
MGEEVTEQQSKETRREGRKEGDNKPLFMASTSSVADCVNSKRDAASGPRRNSPNRAYITYPSIYMMP